MLDSIFTKKNAFTLAETLVTITIIGVVMALMLRSINRVNPDKDKLQFIKTYHAIEAVVANTINDSTKYDQGFYSDQELQDMIDAGETPHVDFRYPPYETAKVTYINENGAEVTVGKNTATNSGIGISRSQAICLFLADSLNTVGNVNCTNNNSMNMKLSTGVGIYNATGVSSAGQLDLVIVPEPDDSTVVTDGYVVRIFKDGKMTVPKSVNNYSNQSTAYDWMSTQTQLNN